MTVSRGSVESVGDIALEREVDGVCMPTETALDACM